MKKHNLYERVIRFLEENWKVMVTVYVLLLLLTPIVVWIFYSVIQCNIYTDISADGILAYCGNIYNAVAALLVAFVAIYQSKSVADIDEELSIQNRQKEICPSLHIDITKIDEDVFEIGVTNYSKYSVIGIYIFEYFLIHHVQAEQNEKRKFSIGVAKQGIVTVDKSYVEINDQGLPQNISLLFEDIDRNIMLQEFEFRENRYECKGIEYC